MKKYVLYTSAVILTAFGLLTLFLSTSVIFDLFGIRAKEAEEKITEAKCKTGINYALSFGK